MVRTSIYDIVIFILILIISSLVVIELLCLMSIRALSDGINLNGGNYFCSPFVRLSHVLQLEDVVLLFQVLHLALIEVLYLRYQRRMRSEVLFERVF